MKAKGIFISTLLVADTFLVAYYVGFNSRSVAVVNHSLAPIETKKPEPKKPEPAHAAPATPPKPAKEATSEKKHKPAAKHKPAPKKPKPG